MSTREWSEEVTASIFDSRAMTRLVLRLKDSIECFWAAINKSTLSSRDALLSANESSSGAGVELRIGSSDGLLGEGDFSERR